MTGLIRLASLLRFSCRRLLYRFDRTGGLTNYQLGFYGDLFPEALRTMEPMVSGRAGAEVGVRTQKLSTIQTVLPIVGAGIATYFPWCEGMAQVAWKFFTCQSECAFPIKSTYNRVDRRPVGLLETKRDGR